MMKRSLTVLSFALMPLLGTCVTNDVTHPPTGCKAGCPEETPLCSEVLERCVQCLEDSQCAGNDKGSYCDVAEGVCAKCLDNAHCAGTPDTPACDAETRNCVQCVSDRDCTNEDLPACHATTHRCVECTKDNFSACGEFACKLSDSSCTDTGRGTLGTCDACETDMECSEGRKCLAHTFGDEELGNFCFLEAAKTGCGDLVVQRRPYSVKAEATSVDGLATEYCFPPVSTTCKGISDTRNIVCSQDSECGIEGLDDGYCPSSGAGAGVCSYFCGGSADCGGTLECGDTPQHCRPPPP